jgi:hypothetical protein
MSRKAVGGVLLVLGLVLVIAGAVLMFVIVPGMKQWPDDVDTTRDYSGRMEVLLNPQTFEFMKGLDVNIQRHVKTEATDGDVALVSEVQTLSTQGQTLQELVKRYAINRKTMEFSTKYPSSWKDKDGFWDREGLVIGWPIDTEKKDYTGWSDDYRATITLKFEGQVTHERTGMTTYLFTSSSEAQPIVSAAVQRMGLPTELPKDQLIALIENTDLDQTVKTMLPTLLQAWPEDNIPLAYYYEYEAQYWIDPRTGAIIDTTKHELRKVSLGEEVIAGTPLALLPEDQRAGLRVPVFDLTYSATDQSVQDAKKDADDAQSDIDLFGTFIPILAMGIGLILIIVGAFMALRKRAAAA